MPRTRVTCAELTYGAVAEEVERIFGDDSLGLEGSGGDDATDAARATFVRACIYLVVKQRCDAIGLNRTEQTSRYLRINRDVRHELAELLETDENEVFRLHHHAAGLRAKNPGYRDVAQAIERRLAKRHGMEA